MWEVILGMLLGMLLGSVLLFVGFLFGTAATRDGSEDA